MTTTDSDREQPGTIPDSKRYTIEAHALCGTVTRLLAEENVKGRPGIVFLTLGLAFVALGAAGQRVFLFIGIAFLAIAIALMVGRSRGTP